MKCVSEKFAAKSIRALRAHNGFQIFCTSGKILQFPSVPPVQFSAVVLTQRYREVSDDFPDILSTPVCVKTHN